jgi:NADPH:quinone reductase-like Zn-dependent oxidoreductase
VPDVMKAAVLHQPGGPEALQVEHLPVPTPTDGQVLIRVKAFGINRSELFTRLGQSPNVKLPRVLGIEAVGTVEQAPGGEFQPGETVASVMGGMGRDFDGGYAEYTCIPAKQVQAVKTSLPWDKLGAIPEMLQTAWGSLYKALQLKSSDRLLIRGGTTSVGLAAAAIAHKAGNFVASTTRNPASADLLRRAGADHVFVDSGTIADDVHAFAPEGFDKVLELIGVTTIPDSLQCTRTGGIVCMTGIVGNKWSFDNFAPMNVIPSAVNFTVYTGESSDFMSMPFQQLVDQVADGSLPIQIGRVFQLDEIVEAHRLMDSNKAGGKIVVLT